MNSTIEKLIQEVEVLAALFGRGGDGEDWGKALVRIERMGKLAKKIRKEAAKARGEP